MVKQDKKSARLMLVATPIGNACDISKRALKVLSQAEVVLAEDTRRAGLLFKRLGIESKGFVSLFEHNEDKRVDQVLQSLAQGQNVALISDAGTPLVSDPGYRLVAACREAGYTVSPIPGPCAATAALSASGLPPHPFTFLGFLPRKTSDKKKLFETYGPVPATLVLFERKDRLLKSLRTAFEVLGPRELCIARELTKEHEQFIQGRLDDLSGLDIPLLGEFTVVIGPPRACGATSGDEVSAILEQEARGGGKPREIVRRVLEKTTGWTSKALYEVLKNQEKNLEPREKH